MITNWTAYRARRIKYLTQFVRIKRIEQNSTLYQVEFPADVQNPSGKTDMIFFENRREVDDFIERVLHEMLQTDELKRDEHGLAVYVRMRDPGLYEAKVFREGSYEHRQFMASEEPELDDHWVRTYISVDIPYKTKLASRDQEAS